MYSRILPQLVCSVLISAYFAGILFEGSLLGLVFVAWPLCWLAGCILALRKDRRGNVLMLWGSALTVVFIVLWQIARIGLVTMNGGLASADGSDFNGLLLLVWIVSALFFILPAGLFFSWNLMTMRREQAAVGI